MTKRVYELEEGDLFWHYSVVNKVVSIRDGRIYYYPVSSARSSERDSFGEKNKMKVEIADPKTIYYGKDKQ